MKTIRFLFLFLLACQSYAQVADFDATDFSKADSMALACQDEGLNNLSELTYKLTAGLTTDAERFRAIYLWVCTNIANDYNLYLKNDRKRQRFEKDSLKLENWNTKFNKTLFKKLLKNEKTICTGYAYLVKKLANLADLNCEIVHGYGRTSTTNMDDFHTPNHSWNAIQLNGKWYVCDPTWASGLQNGDTYKFRFQYNDGFFLTNPKLFVINHFPVDNKWTLLDNEAPTFTDFLEAPIIYGKAYNTLSAHNAPKKMHNTIKKHEKITFNYLLQKPVAQEDISLLIDNGHSPRKTKPTSASIENNALTLEHQFDTNGFYDVHVFIGEDLISTYTVKVKG